MKKYFLFLIVALFAFNAFAQYEEEEETVVEVFEEVFTRRYFKISPLALFEPETSVQLSYEFPINDKIGVEPEVAFITSELFQNVLLDRSFWGAKLKTDLKFYNPSTYIGSNFYHGPQVMYKFVQNNESEWLWDPNFQIQTRHDYSLKRHVFATHYKMGIVSESNNLPIAWDFYIGLGYRYNIVDKSDVPVDINTSLWYEDLFGIEFDKYGILSPVAGVKLCFLHNKK